MARKSKFDENLEDLWTHFLEIPKTIPTNIWVTTQRSGKPLGSFKISFIIFPFSSKIFIDFQVRILRLHYSNQTSLNLHFLFLFLILEHDLKSLRSFSFFNIIFTTLRKDASKHFPHPILVLFLTEKIDKKWRKIHMFFDIRKNFLGSIRRIIRGRPHIT